MTRVRFPILSLMVLIAVVALDMAALNVASEGWADASRHLTVFALAAATGLARYRKGDSNAWWFGFALFGWAYFALVLNAWARLDPISHRPTILGIPPTTFLNLIMRLPGVGNTAGPWPEWWRRSEILQSILTLVVAGIGEVICWILAARRGAPYQERTTRAGRLELGGEEAEP